MAATKAKAARTAVPRIDEVLDTGIRVSENVVKSNTEAAQKGFETIVSMGREALDTAGRAGSEVSGFEKVVDMRKANFEAMVEAGSTFVKGVESLNEQMFAIARRQIEAGAEAQKAMFGAKTFQDAVAVQQGFVKTALDNAVRDGFEISGAWARLAAEAGQPIGRRVSEAISEAGSKTA